jgi:peptidyl-prolyl cis-trans isomerase SurA
MTNGKRPWIETVAIALLCLAGLAVPAAQAEPVPLDRIDTIVDDDVITGSDVALRMAEVRRQIAARGAAMPPADVLERQVRERLILESVQLQLGRRMGIRIDDESLNAAIEGIARQNDITLTAFIDRLAGEGIEYAEFREQLRNDMVMNRVRQRRVNERVRVTEGDVDDFLASADGRDLLASSVRLAHILVAVTETASADEVATASRRAGELLARANAGEDFADLAMRHSEASNALEGGDLGWRNSAQLPPLFAAAITGLEKGAVTGPVRSASGFHLVKVLDRKGDEAHLVDQAKVRHVLIRPSAIRSNSEARDLAAHLRDRIIAGEEFAAVARRHSEDPGSALAGGDLGWVSSGQMVDEFEKMMSDTPQGEISPVFETQFGWHFLQVSERRRQDMSDEFRRMQARNALGKRKFDQETENWLREIRAEAYVDTKAGG